MAKKIVVELIDDLDDSRAEETVSFALDGTSYEIDLSAENAAKLRSDFAQWVAAGRKVTGARKAAPASKAGKSDAAEIREWAKKKGIEVSERGRIPAEIRAQYLADK